MPSLNPCVRRSFVTLSHAVPWGKIEELLNIKSWPWNPPHSLPANYNTLAFPGSIKTIIINVWIYGIHNVNYTNIYKMYTSLKDFSH